MNLKHKAIKGAVWATIDATFTQLISFILVLVLARVLGPTDFGLIALAMIYVALLQIVVDPGFSQALIQRDKLSSSHLDTSLWVSLAVAILLSLLSILLAAPISELYGETALSPVIMSLSPLFLLAAFKNTQRAILTRNFKYKTIAIINIIASTIGGTVGIILAFNGFGVWSLVSQQLTTFTVSTASFWITSSWRPAFNITRIALDDLLGFGISLVKIKLLSFLNTRLDQLLIGLYMGASQLGFYSVARRIYAAMVEVLVRGSSQVALPLFSRLQNEREKQRVSFYRSVEIVSSILVPAFSVVAINAPEIVSILLGSEWQISGHILSILCITGLTFGFSYFTTPMLLSLDLGDIATRIHIFNTTGNVLAFLIGINWGLFGVAAGFAVRAIIMHPIELFYLAKYAGLSIAKLYSKVVPTILAVLLAVMTAIIFDYASLLADGSSLEKLLLKIGTSLSVYLLTLYILNRKLVLELISVFAGLFPRKAL